MVGTTEYAGFHKAAQEVCIENLRVVNLFCGEIHVRSESKRQEVVSDQRSWRDCISLIAHETEEEYIYEQRSEDGKDLSGAGIGK